MSAYEWRQFPAVLPKHGNHDRPADGQFPSWIDRFSNHRVDVSHADGIDDRDHTIGCPCGCEGKATVIKETGCEGAYIASTVDAVTYLKQLGTRGDGGS